MQQFERERLVCYSLDARRIIASIIVPPLPGRRPRLPGYTLVSKLRIVISRIRKISDSVSRRTLYHPILLCRGGNSALYLCKNPCSALVLGIGISSAATGKMYIFSKLSCFSRLSLPRGTQPPLTESSL